MDQSNHALRLCFLADQRSIHVSRQLEYLVRMGHEIHLITFYASPSIPNVNIHIIHSRFARYTDLGFLTNVLKVRRLVWQIKPDILHGIFVVNYGFYSALVGYRPLVISALGSDILVHPYRSRRFRMMAKFAVSKANVVVTDTPKIASIIRAEYDQTKDVLTTPLGVETGLFTPKDLQSVSRSGKWPRFLSFRLLEQNYNIDIIIKSFVAVTRLYPKAELLIAGNGSMMERLHNLCSELGIQDSVRFLGAVAHMDLPKLLGSVTAHISVPTSDGTSVSLLEAMATGTLPIVSDIEANRDWVTDEVNGLIVPVADEKALSEAMLRAATDDHLLERAYHLGVKAIRERAEFGNNMRQIEDWYRMLIK